MEERSVPFLQLMIESWNPESLVLPLVPVVVLIVFAVVVTAIWIRRRRQENAEWKQAEDSADTVAPAQPVRPPQPPLAPIEDSRETAPPVAVSKAPVSQPAVAAGAPEAARPQVPEARQEPKESIKENIVDEIRKVDRGSWLSRLRSGLTKTRDSFGATLSGLFGGGQITDDLIEKIHGALYKADLGVTTTDHLTDLIRKDAALRSNGTWDTARDLLRREITSILSAVEVTDSGKSTSAPWVVLVVGVNGAGKTTTIGKLAGYYASQGKKVILAAGDTFRAAAIEQLQVWGDRAGADVIKQQQGSDPAAVAYDAVKAAIARKADVLIVDTAGRLQNKEGLMAELAKVRRVISKDLPDAPHETWLVIDATTGQNAVSQVKAFTQAAPLSGLVVTKLDGTAKGGFVIGLAHQFKLPIHFIGVGEKASDLRPFSAAEFAESVL